MSVSVVVGVSDGGAACSWDGGLGPWGGLLVLKQIEEEDEEATDDEDDTR